MRSGLRFFHGFIWLSSVSSVGCAQTHDNDPGLVTDKAGQCSLATEKMVVDGSSKTVIFRDNTIIYAGSRSRAQEAPPFLLAAILNPGIMRS